MGDIMRGKLIVIEGNDCSGKETQTSLLVRRYRKEGVRVEHFSYPNYQSPTGKIIGGPYLGRSDICAGYFEEGASHVDPKIAALYFAADRKYNIDKIIFLLEHGVHVIVDRYVYSNMAHQGGKLETKEEREEMWAFLDTLEFGFLALPRPDISIFLHVPLKETIRLLEERGTPDENEKDVHHLEIAEKTFIELADKYHFKTIECAQGTLRTIEDIHEEIYQYIKEKLC